MSRFLFRVAILVLWPTFLIAQPAGFTFDADLSMRAAKAIETFMQQKKIPGLTVAVSIKNQVVWTRGFGFLDIASKEPMRPNTLMRIASISKPITTTAVGVLYDEGEVDLGAPIQKYVPSFPKKKYPISVLQAGQHLGGIRTYREAEYYSKRYFRNVTDALEIFKNDSLMARPGSKYLYSTYSYTLLGAVVEGVSGQDYRSFIRQRVFDPLMMYNTYPEDRARFRMGTAKFYSIQKGKVREAPWVDNSNKWAGGGFLSTAEDVVRFGGGLLAGKLLKQKTLDLFFTSGKTDNGKETGYGFGWGVEVKDGKRFVGHSGSPVGGTAILVMRPEKQLVIAMVCNLQNISLKDLSYQVLTMFENKLK